MAGVHIPVALIQHQYVPFQQCGIRRLNAGIDSLRYFWELGPYNEVFRGFLLENTVFTFKYQRSESEISHCVSFGIECRKMRAVY